MKTIAAIACAVLASLAFNYSTYAQKKAVGDLPEVKLPPSWDVVKAFCANRTWVISVCFMLGGSALYAFAATIAPISIVQPIMACGIALVAWLAIRNLGEKPRRIDLVAIGMSILAVVLLAISLAEGLPEDLKHSAVPLWILTGGVVLLSVIIPLVMRGSNTKRAAGLGIACGLLYGASAVFVKLLLVDWSNRWSHQGIGVLFASVFVIAWLLLMVPAFVILQAALQKGMAIVVAPLMSSLSQLVPIFIGMIALHEQLPHNPALTALRFTAFALMLIATVILSKRAEEAGEVTGLELPAPVEPGMPVPEMTEV